MIERISLKVNSKFVEPFSVQLLRHQVPSKVLAVMFPGGDNTVDVPTLHYARKAALLQGCDVLSLKYGFNEKRALHDQNINETLVDECFGVINQMPYQDYHTLVFISKSFGNLIAVDVDKKYFSSKVSHILYTPIDKLAEKLLNQKALIFTGEKDGLIKPETVSRFKQLENKDIHEIPEAVHSLEVNDDIGKSLKILEQVTYLTRTFIKQEINKDL